MIEVRRADGVWFRVTHPGTVETNGGKLDQESAKLYERDYKLQREGGDRHWTEHHEFNLAEIIYDTERAEVFDDSKITVFVQTEGMVY